MNNFEYGLPDKCEHCPSLAGLLEEIKKHEDMIAPDKLSGEIDAALERLKYTFMRNNPEMSEEEIDEFMEENMSKILQTFSRTVDSIDEHIDELKDVFIEGAETCPGELRVEVTNAMGRTLVAYFCQSNKCGTDCDFEAVYVDRRGLGEPDSDDSFVEIDLRDDE